MLDLLICGLFVYGVAKLLNTTIFNLNPASKVTAWTLTVVMFFVLAGVLTVLFAWRSPGISHIAPGIALAFAWMFYFLLDKQVKKQSETFSAPSVSCEKLKQKSLNGSFSQPQNMGNKLKNKEVVSASAEDIYKEIGQELEDGNVKLALWTQAFAESDGDEPKAKSFYIKLRFNQLSQNYLTKEEAVSQNQSKMKKYAYSADELAAALDRAESIHDPIYKVSELLRIAKEYILIGQFEEPNIVLDKAFGESDEIRYFEEKDLSLGEIVSGYLSVGNIESAYKAALSIEDYAIKALSFAEIADKYEDNDEKDKAKNIRAEACKLSSEIEGENARLRVFSAVYKKQAPGNITE